MQIWLWSWNFHFEVTIKWPTINSHLVFYYRTFRVSFWQNFFQKVETWIYQFQPSNRFSKKQLFFCVSQWVSPWFQQSAIAIFFWFRCSIGSTSWIDRRWNNMTFQESDKATYSLVEGSHMQSSCMILLLINCSCFCLSCPFIVARLNLRRLVHSVFLVPSLIELVLLRPEEYWWGLKTLKIFSFLLNY